jgi:hypothetical protein
MGLLQSGSPAAILSNSRRPAPAQVHKVRVGAKREGWPASPRPLDARSQKSRPHRPCLSTLPVSCCQFPKIKLAA